MGTVRAPPTAGRPPALGAAVDAYLASLRVAGKHGAAKSYMGVLRPLAGHFGHDCALTTLDPAAVASWYEERWGQASAPRWNVARSALLSAAEYWRGQGWPAGCPAARLPYRRVPADRDRALSRAHVQALLTREDIPLRERALWRMLYETAARSAEVLALNAEDLDLGNRRARVRRKGGAVDMIVWQTGTARLLPRLLRGRKSGPLFLTDRKARVELPPGDIDPTSGRARLSYRQAEGLFRAASGGATLHQLRHSALSHAAEDGTSTPILMARSGHTSVRSLVKYARVSVEALQRHMAETDPARRARPS